MEGRDGDGRAHRGKGSRFLKSHEFATIAGIDGCCRYQHQPDASIDGFVFGVEDTFPQLFSQNSDERRVRVSM